MFSKSRHNKSNQGYSNYNSSLGISIHSSKYHPNIYSKKKSITNKKNKNKFSQNHTWKKQNTCNNWNKENDQNYLNCDYYEENEYYYYPKENRENKFNYNKDNSHFENNEYFKKSKNFQKNEKKISIDSATTKSNSSSHEESNNNNQYNSIDNNISIPSENYNSNNSRNSEKENIVQNNNKIDVKNVTPNFINYENYENNNFNPNIILSDCNPNVIDNIKFPIPPTSIPQAQNLLLQQKKNKNQKKKKFCSSSKELDIKRSMSATIENNLQLNNEPFNKFNSVNNELISPNLNPIIENTDILQVNVKIAKDKNVLFKLRRFDDLFLTVKLFCEINSIEEKLIKPIISKTLCTLNSIYQVYNAQIDSNNMNILKMVKTLDNDTSI